MSDSEEEGPSPAAMQVPTPTTPYPICRLTDKNYQAWSIKIEMALKRENLWKYVSDPPALLRGEDKHGDERAQALIILSMDDELLVHIRGLQTAKECWDVLKELYKRESVASKIALSRRLYRTRLEPGESLNAHLRKMKQYFKDLDDMGVAIPEFQKALTVLSSLDSSWDTFALTLESVPEATLTLSYLSGRLLQEEEKRMENSLLRGRTGHKAQPSRRTSEKPGGEESTQAYVVKKRVCFRCGGDSHLARDCMARRPTRKGRKQQDFVKYQAAMVHTQSAEKKHWLIDSGSSQHICCDPGQFITLHKSQRDHVSLANGGSEAVTGMGQVYVPYLKETLHDVLCVPKLKQNLLSVACLAQKGYTVLFKKGACILTKEGKSVKAMLKDNVFTLGDYQSTEKAQVHYANEDCHRSCVHLWHKRLAHINLRYVQRTAELARGIKLNSCSRNVVCEPCAVAKSKRASVSKHSNRQSTRILELVHADVCGPMRESIGKARYFLLLVDDYSRFSFCYPMKQKSEVFQKLKQWVAMVERRHGQKVSQLQTDRGGEFMNTVMANWLQKKGIIHRKTNPYSPAENGVAERYIGRLTQIKDTLLSDTKLSPGWWAELLLTGNFLANRSYCEAIQDIPYKLFFGRTPDLSYLKCVGASAWVHIPKAQRRKGQVKAQKLTFIGYEPHCKGYRFLAPDRRSIIVSRSAKFCEKMSDGNGKNHSELYLPIPTEAKFSAQPQLTPGKLSEGMQAEGGGIEKLELTPSRQTAEAKQEAVSPSEQSVSPQGRIFTRTTRGIPPQRLVVGHVNVDNANMQEPQTYEEISQMSQMERVNWQQAMRQEMNAMEQLGVFTLCDLPEGHKAVGSRWVYRLKTQEGKDPVYRARLVAQGFSQERYTQYTDVFSPTVVAPSIRVLFTIAAHKGWEIQHYDVRTAYLNAPLEEEIYMRPAPGFDEECTGKVYRLNKAIYGLKQAARQWNLCLDKVLKGLGFQPTKADPCIYTRGVANHQIILAAFVDDLLLTALDRKQIRQVAQQLEKSFKMKHLGPVNNYLGVQVQKVTDGYKFCQSQKIVQLLQKWRMDDCKPAKTPMAVEHGITEGAGEKKPCNADHYRSLLGSLQHIATWSRPDICHCVSVFSRAASNPTEQDWNGLKRILRYLKGTVNYKLSIQASGPLWLTCYADSDWAGAEDRKSTSGIAIMLGDTLVEWKAKRQSCIAMSTCEAEFASISYLVTELIWFKQLVTDLGITDQGPIIVHEDNEACIQLATAEKVHSRSKHVHLRYCNVRDAVNQGLIQIVYCPSENNAADILTKALSKIKHERGLQLLGICNE